MSPVASQVALVTQSFLDDGRMKEGGAERHLLHLARVLRGLHLPVVIYDCGHPPGSFQVNGVHVECLGGLRQVALRRAVATALRHGAVHIHFQYLGEIPIRRIPASVSASFHGVWWDIPYEARYRAWYPLGSLARVFLPLWRRYRRIRTILDVARCRWVLAVDTSLLRIIQSDYPRLRRRIAYIPNFFDTEQDIGFPDRANPRASRLGQVPAERSNASVLIPRNVSLSKGAAWLVEIAEQVYINLGNPVDFVLTGHPVTGLGNRQYALLRRDLEMASPAVAAHFQLLGGVAHDAMPALFQKSDIVLIPTFAYEGTSLAALEGMASGRPIVATNIGGLNDLILDGITGRLVPPEPGLVAEAITQLVRSPELAAQMGEAARRRAQELFTLARWESSVTKLFEPLTMSFDPAPPERGST